MKEGIFFFQFLPLHQHLANSVLNLKIVHRMKLWFNASELGTRITDPDMNSVEAFKFQ